jgi:4-hydroxy-2-oxoheptanedioate aldolase
VGFDFAIIDWQHGLIDYSDLWPMLQAVRWSPLTPLVRVPENALSPIGKALDAGAAGVVVPLVNTREDAELAVAGTRYPPEGVRSFGPLRASMLLGLDTDAVNRKILCLVMIESVAGLANVDEIVSTPGVDGVLVGPADLALTMGIRLRESWREDSELLKRIQLVQNSCARHGRIAGIAAGSAVEAAEFVNSGFTMCAFGSDAGIMRGAAGAELDAARRSGGLGGRK